MSKVGDKIKAENGSWTFSGDVSQTFDEHVSKSVPFYKDGHDLVVKLSDFFLNDDSICYELGASTGQLTKSLAIRNANKQTRFIAVDLVPEMVEKAKENCKGHSNIECVVDDIIEMDLEPSDMIICYYTIQFIKPKLRQLLFDKIYQSLNWGGALILFEKIRGSDARFQDIFTAIYTDYKIDQGYNADQIISKTRSLKGVLEPFSTQGNIDLMKRAGFVDIETIMKYVCFEGYLAIK